jgi:hypothetical protein
VPGKIDLLIGAYIFYEIIRSHNRTRPGNNPVLKKTALGWIISGRTPAVMTCDSQHTLLLKEDNSLKDNSNYFCEGEQVEQSTITTKQQICEKHSLTNTKQSNGNSGFQHPSKIECQQRKETSYCLSPPIAKKKGFTTRTQPTDVGNAKSNKDIPHHETTCKISAGNRVVANQENPSSVIWKCVTSQSNPADVTLLGINTSTPPTSSTWRKKSPYEPFGWPTTEVTTTTDH